MLPSADDAFKRFVANTTATARLFEPYPELFAAEVLDGFEWRGAMEQLEAYWRIEIEPEDIQPDRQLHHDLLYRQCETYSLRLLGCVPDDRNR